MFSTIAQFFDEHMMPDEKDSDAIGIEHQLQLATAALLIETSRADFETKDSEEAAVVDNLLLYFELPQEELDELKALAEREADEHVSLHQFTSLINQHFELKQKERVIEMMWRVSYADGEVDAHEKHLIRKVAGLVHVPHSAYIAAKMRAKPPEY